MRRTFVTALFILIMKSLLKFTLLSALIIGGRLTKQPSSVTAQVSTQPSNNGTVVLVHQVLTSEPVPPAQEQDQPHSGNGLIAELF